MRVRAQRLVSMRAQGLVHGPRGWYVSVRAQRLVGVDLAPPAIVAAEILPDHIRRLGRARHSEGRVANGGQRDRPLLE